MPTSSTTAAPAAEQQAALHLIELYDERWALTKAMNAEPTLATAEATLAKATQLATACETFRRRYYPRKHRVVVGQRTVMAVSRAGRSVVTILDGNDR